MENKIEAIKKTFKRRYNNERKFRIFYFGGVSLIISSLLIAISLNVTEEQNNSFLKIFSFSMVGVAGIVVQKTKRANRIITKQKEELDKQKEIIESKNKDILDSIRYAKRIQTSLLPTDKYLNRVLGDKNKNTGA